MEALGAMIWPAASAAAAVVYTLQPGPLLAIGTLLVGVRRHFIVFTCVNACSSLQLGSHQVGLQGCLCQLACVFMTA
jgi:hypothetical protein